MSKYIIEIEEGKEGVMFCQSGIVSIGLHLKDEESLRGLGIRSAIPYAEPDLDAIRKEAYEKGVQDTKQHWVDAPRSCAYKLGYENGLNDAWDAARKVTQVRKYGGYGDCLEEVFGRHRVPWDVFDYSASECIEKIRQYEQEKEEQIQIGDEIETPSGLKGYVVNFTDDELVHYVSSEGRFETMGTSAVSKTGRHFPEIAAVLKKMKES